MEATRVADDAVGGPSASANQWNSLPSRRETLHVQTVLIKISWTWDDKPAHKFELRLEHVVGGSFGPLGHSRN